MKRRVNIIVDRFLSINYVNMKRRLFLLLKGIFLLSLLFYLFHSIVYVIQDYNDNSSGNSNTRQFSYFPNKLDTKTVVDTKKSFIDASVEQHLSSLEIIFEESVKEFYRVYSQRFKPNLSKALVRPSEALDEIYSMDEIRPTCELAPTILVQVHSAPLNVKKRLAIRYSWGSNTNIFNVNTKKNNDTFKTVFVIGRSKIAGINEIIIKEAKTYNDILLMNAIDTYRELANKTIFTLKWALKYCFPKYMAENR